MTQAGANTLQSDMRKQTVRKCDSSRKRASSGGPACLSRPQQAFHRSRHPSRVPNGAFERLEPCARKRASTVLRGGSGGNAASLLDNVIAETNPLGNTFSTTFDNQNRP